MMPYGVFYFTLTLSLLRIKFSFMPYLINNKAARDEWLYQHTTDYLTNRL